MPFSDLIARYVHIQLRGTNYLSLKKIEVWGLPLQTNLAIGRLTRQSSNNFGTSSIEAVDGNLSDSSVTHTHPENQAW